MNDNLQTQLEKVQGQVNRLSEVTREVQTQLTEVMESKEKMQNEQQKWRTDKESEFEQQIKDISSKIDSEMNPEGDTLEDENKKL